MISQSCPVQLLVGRQRGTSADHPSSSSIVLSLVARTVRPCFRSFPYSPSWVELSSRPCRRLVKGLPRAMLLFPAPTWSSLKVLM